MDRRRTLTSDPVDSSESPGASPARDAARRLLSRVPRTEVSPVAKARVWAKLRRREPAARARFVQRFALVALLLCSSIAFAANRLAHLGAWSPSRLFGDAEHALPSVAPPAVSPLALVPPSAATTPETPEAPQAQAPPTPVAHEETPALSPIPVASPAAPRLASPPSPSAARPDEEADLVLDGLRALRRDHDPSRARALFGRYVGRHPQGPLVEDALGYSLEAADAEGSGSAARLAESYLKSYPHGRYAVLAERLRNRPMP